MKLWIVVGALRGQIIEANIFIQEKEALECEQRMRKHYSFPKKISNDVALFEKEI